MTHFKKRTEIMDWKIAYIENYKYKELAGGLKTIDEIKRAGLDIIPAEVPGNFELDLQRAGILEDLYFSDNVYAAQKLENMHVFYFTEAQIKNEKEYLRFEGIDTIADIYVNGELAMSTDNMNLSYDVFADYKTGKNEIVVHIKPVAIEARKKTLSAINIGHDQGYGSLYIRKAPHSYGWDIMPRILSTGIWKPVRICEKKKDEIKEVFIYTNAINYEKNTAYLQCFINVDVSGDFIKDYSARVEGRCGESEFKITPRIVNDVENEYRLWHNTQQFGICVPDCKLWWPKNHGEQNLYDVKVELLFRGETVDSCSLRTGIRKLKLIRTGVTDKNGGGKFQFEVNDKKIFVLGTNWVPMDALHSQDIKRLPKALELLDDVGCNMVRCWGGNVYESDEFFDFCDEHGIMVWQDFSMACATYPQGADFADMMREEAVYEIKRLRNHASLALWAGDNECDQVITRWDGGKKIHDPNMNIITREVLKRAVFEHDPSRDFLPSSPYMSPEYIKSGEDGVMPENHLWGPRDYFKSEYYNDTFCHFASEIGYHGFNSPKSLEKFLKNPDKVFEDDGFPTREYSAHAAAWDDDERVRFGYHARRIRLAHEQVDVLFSERKENLEDFVRQSQISQAEAKKYFIEKFRIGKGIRTGIIWWNLIDGWPQVSDAVVDYYYTKKLAYSYIKRSQAPVCLMFSEPEDGKITLVGVNDREKEASVKYKVTNVTTGKALAEGEAQIGTDSVCDILKTEVEPEEHTMYLIEWELDGKRHKNHYYTNLRDVDYSSYKRDMEKCKMDEWEGF